MSHIETEDSPPADFHILDLFAGPGGLDVAADALGYRVTGIEWDAGACATRGAAGMDTFHGDVRTYRAAFFPRAQVLTGGPPCQTFTVAGHGAGRRALDQVLEYIGRLHEVVRATEGRSGDPEAWLQVFRTWRKIHEELRRKELEAQAVRDEKHGVERLRVGARKAIRNRLEQLGNSAEEIKQFLKKLKEPQAFELTDGELRNLLKVFGDLDHQLSELKDKLEKLGDERTGLVLQPLWWIIERCRRPGSNPYEAVVLEQVPAVMLVWERYVEVLASLHYRTATQLMHTEAFGVPQTRRRAVLMARLDRPGLPEGPEPGSLPKVRETHELYHRRGSFVRLSKVDQMDPLFSAEPAACDEEPGEEREHWISMEAALNHVEKRSGGKVHRRPAFSVVSNYGTGGVPEARGRRDHDTPSSTITGKVSRNRVVHKGTDKDLDGKLGRFNTAEAGVLQTFPWAYPWSGNDVSQQIGNAVPPRLALHILLHVLEYEPDEKKARERMNRRIEKLENWKPRQPVKPLEHSDLKGHPLTGR
ncbi:DNA cytosine methyltransferase [Streptomyces sp. NPDC012825]|uniref:DNA cytosine methyltransferase n=1 Tax=Streptomyces sp. NPDC012825 TaxID=3364851 RepID=UPI003678F868